MSRIFAIILPCIFALNIFGVFAVFRIQRLQIRREIKAQIKQGISEKELFKITVAPEHASALSWKKDDEFRYKGIMYDVVRKEIINDSTIIYYCISDRQETALFANLDELVRKGMHSRKDSNKPLENLFNLFSKIFYHTREIAPIDVRLDGLVHCARFDGYTSPFLRIPSPPPELV
ncbi:MAG: hypothetical protein KDD02_19350 [Phaeodactylibacter sp.]|nr:hypothetical protein [Phaeodactylibacter sp.]MCB9300909.1 hypothetical protein [Lewinellaceae bacterium]